MDPGSHRHGPSMAAPCQGFAKWGFGFDAGRARRRRRIRSAGRVQGVRPLSAMSRVCSSASAATTTRGPYCPLGHEGLGHRLQAHEHLVDDDRIERLVEPGRGARSHVWITTSPSMIIPIDCSIGLLADVLVGEGPCRLRRIVEQGLQLVGESGPRADRVGVDRRTRRELHARPGEERRHPLDHVADDVARHPPVARRRTVPRVGRDLGGAIAESPSACGTARRSSRRPRADRRAG